MKYLPLFSLEILHDFFANERCTDLSLESAPGTQKLLGKYRCTLKFLPNGLQVLAPITEEGLPLIPISQGTVFGFYLRLENQDFPLFTDMTEINQMISPSYTNVKSDPVLHLVSDSPKATESFIVRQPAKAEQFTLGGKPRPALQPKEFVIEGLDRVSAPNSYDEAGKVITVNSKSVAEGTPFTVSYPSIPLLERGVFAQVQIKYSDRMLQNLERGNLFQLRFKSKDTRWKYYLVLDKVDTNPLVPVIEDKEKGILFKVEDRTDLVETPDVSDPIAVQLAKQHPDRQYYRFVSSSLVPCRETTRKA
ncbi:MAG TPA: hypothetical protein VFK94_05110, partial [Patescibacteria group bacterium]|nr:hypothetical protein [Patescibacteria group bacterium]